MLHDAINYQMSSYPDGVEFKEGPVFGQGLSNQMTELITYNISGLIFSVRIE